MPSGIYKRKSIIKIGDKFGRLTAVRFDYYNNYIQYWLFKCDCKNEKVISVSAVKKGNTKSCGCLYRKARTIHGMSRTRTYKSWNAMKNRCLNKRCKDYKDYGGRGITICDRWMRFENFFEDMGERPIGKSIDRINNDGNYCKSNCKWSTPKEQSNNMRNNIN